MIQKWKSTSQKFTKFLFLTDIKTFDDQNLLQKHCCKYLTYKNKRIFFEYYIWGNDFFINRCRLSNYIYLWYFPRTSQFYTDFDYNVL